MHEVRDWMPRVCVENWYALGLSIVALTMMPAPSSDAQTVDCEVIDVIEMLEFDYRPDEIIEECDRIVDASNCARTNVIRLAKKGTDEGFDPFELELEIQEQCGNNGSDISEEQDVLSPGGTEVLICETPFGSCPIGFMDVEPGESCSCNLESGLVHGVAIR